MITRNTLHNIPGAEKGYIDPIKSHRFLDTVTGWFDPINPDQLSFKDF